MIPIFIPVVNRLDLLERAVASIPRRMTIGPVVINNTGSKLSLPCKVLEPPVPLDFSRTQNWMLKIAKEEKHPFYGFCHSDAAAGPDTVQQLYQMAMHETSQRKWGAIFTAYDALAVFNTEAMDAIGGWDTNLSWYASDCDCYRRLRRAGYPTLEKCLDVKHTPSSTLNSDPAIRRAVELEIPFRQAYYRAKWGGDNGHETFDVPWGGK